ncbi:phage antirepressor KilAC domain-containing protein [Rhodococcus sp. MALMAid1271]
MSLPSVPTSSPFDQTRQIAADGTEYWSTRSIQDQMGYPTWQHFEAVLERAMNAASNQGYDVDSLFTVNREKTGGRTRMDYNVTRFAAYLIAMNGDPRKTEVAAAQAYFAIRTREAEVTAPALTEEQIVHQALQITVRKVKELESAVAEMAPKVDAYDRFIDTDGTYSVGSTAKMLGRSQNKLFTELRNSGILITKGAMRNTPYQRYMHHFAVKAFDFERSDGSHGTSYSTRVQPSGVAFIARKLGLAAVLELEASA